jgi:hypothetical protein
MSKIASGRLRSKLLTVRNNDMVAKQTANMYRKVRISQTSICVIAVFMMASKLR